MLFIFMHLQRKHNRSDTGTLALQYLPPSLFMRTQTKFAYGISVSPICYSIKISLALKVKLEKSICPHYWVLVRVMQFCLSFRFTV